MSQIVKIVDYSEKSIAVIGDTKEIKDKFKVDGQYIGRFNKFLSIKDDETDEVTKQVGWIFQIKHRAFVENIVAAFLKENKPTIEDVFTNAVELITEEQEQISLF